MVVAAGLTIKGFAVPKPPLQEYVVAPVAVRVVGAPEQIVIAAGVIETGIVGLTVTVATAVAVAGEQPGEEPVTV